MERRIGVIKSRLNAQHYVMNDTWMTDCIEYYLAEHDNTADNELLNFVKSQFQLSNLRDINNEKGSLPANLQQQKCTKLLGNYMLQIEKGYDISTSKYKQLGKIRNVSNENIEATEAEKRSSTDENGKRMLNLFLTDGIQDVTAIEYRPIPTFKANTLIPGYKLLVKGPVMCRRGVILLEAQNVVGVGGEIDTLLVHNATENVLARALDLPENENPYATDNSKYEENTEDLFDDKIDFDIQELDTIQELDAKNRCVNTLDDSLSNLSVNKKRKSINKMPMTQRNRRNSGMIDELPVSFEQQPTNDVVFLADSDDEWMGYIDENNLTVVEPNISHQPAKPNPSENNRNKTNFNATLPAKLQTVAEQPSFEDPELIIPMDIEFDDFECDTLPEPEQHHLPNNSNYPLKIQSPPISNNSTPKRATNFSLFDKKIIPSCNPEPPSYVQQTPKSITPQKKIQASTFLNSSKIIKKSSSPNKIKMTPKITDFMVRTDAKTSSVPEKVSDSVKDVIDAMPAKKLIYKKVQAAMKKIYKLSKNESCWCLDGILSDGKDAVEVSFSNECLEGLIGYTVIQFMNLKKRKRTEPQVVEIIRSALRNAEAKLTKFIGYFKIELAPNASKPKVVELLPLTPARK